MFVIRTDVNSSYSTKGDASVPTTHPQNMPVDVQRDWQRSGRRKRRHHSSTPLPPLRERQSGTPYLVEPLHRVSNDNLFTTFPFEYVPRELLQGNYRHSGCIPIRGKSIKGGTHVDKATQTVCYPPLRKCACSWSIRIPGTPRFCLWWAGGS